MTWTIYAVTVADEIQYVGHAKDMGSRECQHRGDRFYDIDCKIVALDYAKSKAGAVRTEARLIRRHKPKYNIQFNGSRAYVLVDTVRATGQGEWLPCRFRLFDGMLHPDKAREIWHRSLRRDAGAVLKRMPGWTRSRASHFFGPRQKVGSKGVIL